MFNGSFTFNFENLNNGPVDMEIEKNCINCKELFQVINKNFNKEDYCSNCKNIKQSKIGLCVTCRAAPINKVVSIMCNHCKMRFIKN